MLEKKKRKKIERKVQWWGRLMDLEREGKLCGVCGTVPLKFGEALTPLVGLLQFPVRL